MALQNAWDENMLSVVSIRGRRRHSYFCLFPAPFRIPRRRRRAAAKCTSIRWLPLCTRLICGPSHAMGVRSNRVYPLPKQPRVRYLPSSWKAFPIANNFARSRRWRNAVGVIWLGSVDRPRSTSDSVCRCFAWYGALL